MHSLIVGTTASGKTTLAKRLCQKFRDQGDLTIVFTPMEGDEWAADEIWEWDGSESDVEAFLDFVFSHTSAHVFVDEAGDVKGRVERRFTQLASKGRHWGHRVYFISQRSRDIHIRIRNNCLHVFAFSQYRYDAELLAQDFNDDALLQAEHLPQGQCIVKERFKPAQHLRVFDPVS